MRILIFTAKWIGARCVEYLADHFPEDEYTVVVCEPEGDQTIEMLMRKKLSYLRLSEEVIRDISDTSVGHFDWLLNLWGDIFSRSLYFQEHVRH